MSINLKALEIVVKEGKKHGKSVNVNYRGKQFVFSLEDKYAHGSLTGYIAKCFNKNGIHLDPCEAIQIKNEYFKGMKE
jgi:hypothetical protein